MVITMAKLFMAHAWRTQARMAHTSRLGQKERRAKVGNNNGQLRIANATSGGARKAAWAKMASFASVRHGGSRTQAGWINK